MDAEFRERIKQLEARHDCRIEVRPRLPAVVHDYSTNLKLLWWAEMLARGEQVPNLVVGGEVGSGKSSTLRALSYLPVEAVEWLPAPLDGLMTLMRPTLILMDEPWQHGFSGRRTELAAAFQLLRRHGRGLARGVRPLARRAADDGRQVPGQDRDVAAPRGIDEAMEVGAEVRARSNISSNRKEIS